MNTPETPKPDDTELRAVVRKMRNEVAELQQKDREGRYPRLPREYRNLQQWFQDQTRRR